MTPRIVHSIHFQWDENQKVNPLGAVFDMTPHLNMRAFAPDFDVRLWTFPLCRDFCIQYYPSVWDVLKTCPRPVMMIDVLRWLVVSHFGGIYWQMRTTPLVPMQNFLPSPGKAVRLFTENVMSPAQCQAMTAEPIRAGKPEEPIRISNQVFSASPGAPYLQKTIGFLLNRIQTMTPKKDYDVLYISANAAVSEAYDTFGKNDSDVELTSLEQTRRIMKWRYGGSWRKDKSPAHKSLETLPASLPITQADRFPALASMYYTWIKPHLHERWFDQQDMNNPRTSCLPLLQSIIVKQNIQTVFEAPCGLFQPTDVKCHYTGGDPSRRIIRENRLRATQSHTTFRHVQMLYSRFPEVDLFVCPNFLEWLPFSEAFRLLRRILLSKPRFLALTGYPLLTETWDTAFGDFRPLNPLLPPFCFPEPLATLPWPPTSTGRPDRHLFLWPTQSIPLLPTHTELHR